MPRRCVAAFWTIIASCRRCSAQLTSESHAITDQGVTATKKLAYCIRELDGEITMDHPHKLRELATWYREFAERTANTAIWDARLRMAEDLELEAQRIERTDGQKAREDRAVGLVRLAART